MCVYPSERKSESEVAQSCLTLCDPMDGSLPGKNTGVGCHLHIFTHMHKYTHICISLCVKNI